MKSDSKLERPPVYFTEKFNDGDRKQLRFIRCYSDILVIVNKLSMHLSIVSTRIQRAGNPWEIDRLLLPEDRTFGGNIFSQGGKIEHPRADFHLASFSNGCYRSFIINETCHQVKLAKVANSAKMIDFFTARYENNNKIIDFFTTRYENKAV